MDTVVFSVKGMSCRHSVYTIEGALIRLEGVYHSVVELEDRMVKVMYDHEKQQPAVFREAIRNAGYQVEEREEQTASKHERRVLVGS